MPHDYSKAEILAHVDEATSQDSCRASGTCELDGADEVEAMIETLAGLILDLQSRFEVSASNGYSSEALRYGRAFKGMLQLHDSLVVQYERWYLTRWGKPPVYCKLQAEEFAIGQ